MAAMTRTRHSYSHGDLTLVLDCADLARAADFWTAALGYVRDGTPVGTYLSLLPAEGVGCEILLQRVSDEKRAKNRLHLDLRTRDLAAEVDRVLALGATLVTDQPIVEAGWVWHLLADPDGNEFCVIEAGNTFLADTGVIGALSCDGTQEVGYFWSEALRWPLVWDQDQETAIQSPNGGTKITWGGPPVAPKTGPNRLYFELALPPGTGWEEEVDRLVSLGATRTEIGEGHGGSVLMLDPDGNEFSVQRPR